MWSITKLLFVIGIVVAGVTVIVVTTTVLLLHPSSSPVTVVGATPAAVTTKNLTNCTVIYVTYKKSYYGTNTTLVAFDTDSGLSFEIGDTADPIYRLFISPNNTLYGIGIGPQFPYGNGFSLYIVDPLTAALTLLCETYIQYDPYHGLGRIDMDSNGVIWMQGDAPELLYKLDPATCNATAISSAVLAFTYGGMFNDTFYYGKTPEDTLYKQSLTPPYTVSLVGSVGIPVTYGLTSRLFTFCPSPGDNRLQMGWQYTAGFVNFTSLNPNTGAPIPGTQFSFPLSNSQYSAWAFSSSCWCT